MRVSNKVRAHLRNRNTKTNSMTVAELMTLERLLNRFMVLDNSDELTLSRVNLLIEEIDDEIKLLLPF